MEYNKQEAERIGNLLERWCPFGWVKDLYGIDLRDEPTLVEAANRRGRIKEVPPDKIDRYGLEGYFQQFRVLPTKWAAARLGMNQKSFEDMRVALQKQGQPVPKVAESRDSLVMLDFIENIRAFFPYLKRHTYGDHTSFCKALHAAILSDLKIQVEPLLCVTSEWLIKHGSVEDIDYAQAFDCITLKPVGLRYQVWLKTGKPMNLRPDVCSLLFYAQHKKQLSKFRMGTLPVMPNSLCELQAL